MMCFFVFFIEVDDSFSFSSPFSSMLSVLIVNPDVIGVSMVSVAGVVTGISD